MQMSIDPKRKFGPNFRKLVIHKMSMEAIPNGGGFADGIKFLSSPATIKEEWVKAQEWCESAVDAIRKAGDPNPFRDFSEEEISAEILKQLGERKQ
jgi:hypothetical protein